MSTRVILYSIPRTIASKPVLKGQPVKKKTVIIGKVSIAANHWIINAIVFENTDKAIEVQSSEDIRLMNFVINEVKDKAITVPKSTDVNVDNLVVENIEKNVIDFRYFGKN